MRSFPSGACGDASLLIGTFLTESGFGAYDYVSGERGGRYHVWIANRDLVVDITADQFSDAPHSVIVERNSSWHEPFNGTAQHEAHIRVYGPDVENEYEGLYKDIVNEMSGAT